MVLVCRMADRRKVKNREGKNWSDMQTEPSTASTEYILEDVNGAHVDGSDEGECRKGAWTAEEDRELSRLIEVSMACSVGPKFYSAG